MERQGGTVELIARETQKMNPKAHLYSLYVIKATRKPLKLLSKSSYGNCIQLADAKWKLWKDDPSTPSGMALLVFLSADEERLDAMEVSGSADLECEVITQYGSY